MVNFNFFWKKSQNAEPKVEETPQVAEPQIVSLVDKWEALSEASAESVEKSDLVRTKSGREGFVTGSADDVDGRYFEIQYDNGNEGIRKSSSLRALAVNLDETEFGEFEENMQEESEEEFCWGAQRQLTVRQVKALNQIKKKLKGAEIFASEEFDCREYGWVQTLRGKLQEYDNLLEAPNNESEGESKDADAIFTDFTIRCLAEVKRLLSDLDHPVDEDYGESVDLSDMDTSEVETQSEGDEIDEELFRCAYE